MLNRNNILKITGVALAMLFGVAVNSALAANATLSWTANTEPDLAGYKIYYGTAKRTAASPGSNNGGYQNKVDAGKVIAYTLNNLNTSQKYYFSLTAYDTSNNESGFSSEVGKIFGDVDKNGTVQVGDFNLFLDNFGKTGVNSADIDGSSKVDIGDFNILLDNFGKTL
jgi:hypothetical protein